MGAINWFENTDISLTEFMSEHWRRQPKAFKRGLESSLENLDLTLLYKDIVKLTALDTVESRLVRKVKDTFSLSLGPFSNETVSSALSKPNNMLMLQGADQHIATLSHLLTKEFNFIPRWRIEDIMVTVGGSGASCGPHFDHYDVFLFQVRGEKHWHWDSLSHKDEELDQNSDIRLLSSFSPEASQIMTPGDVLYIPPGAGHWGVASDDSMTLSIGIRNPTMMELVSSYTDELLDVAHGTETLDDNMDPTFWSMSASSVDNLQGKYIDFVSNRELMSAWFGCYMTELKEPDLLIPMTPKEVSLELESYRDGNRTFSLALATRIAYQAEVDTHRCFLNGQMFELETGQLKMVEQLCINRKVSTDIVFEAPANVSLIELLLLTGAIQSFG
ncbi:MAG: 50S ribosomal protein L16 3-hydroxylase [Candidatus Azotimanducaceae bacterium]|jgi:50S ribosomal protein L16 3-hydroxylase